jgi:DNA repair exonuclease SbcCD ATPase subunit
MDYFGPMVNRSARVESVANGGQIVMSSNVYDLVADQLKDCKFAPEVLDLGTFDLKGLNDATHILQILPDSLKERKFAAVVTKEQALAEEKKKLEDQLLEMEKKNKELADRLSNMDSDVENQMSQANKLLADVQTARLAGAPSGETLDLLKNQLRKLLDGQSSTAKEIQMAQVTNEELFKQANLAAERREQIAVQSLLNDKANLESDLNEYRSQLEDRKEKEASLLNDLEQAKKRLENLKSLEDEVEDSQKKNRRLKAELEEETTKFKKEEKLLKEEIRELEERLKKSREDRIELMNLRLTVSELQAQVESGGGAVAAPESSPSGNRIVGPSGGRSPIKSPRQFEQRTVPEKKLERALVFKMCYGCDLAIKDEEYIDANGHLYHDNCFACGVCGKLFNGARFYIYKGKAAHGDCRGDDY